MDWLKTHKLDWFRATLDVFCLFGLNFHRTEKFRVESKCKWFTLYRDKIILIYIFIGVSIAPRRDGVQSWFEILFTFLFTFKHTLYIFSLIIFLYIIYIYIYWIDIDSIYFTYIIFICFIYTLYIYMFKVYGHTKWIAGIYSRYQFI